MRGLICALLWLAAAHAAAEDAPPALPELSIALAPGGLDAAGDPSFIDVTTRISGWPVAAQAPFLKEAVTFAGVPAVPYTAADLAVRDGEGPVELAESTDAPDEGGFLYFRRWTASRPLAGVIELHYRAPIGNYVPPLGAGPPFDLRAQGGGFSGAGNHFLVLPDTGQPFRIDIRWDLTALAEGSVAVSSLGDGDVQSAGPSDRLIASYFMAGPLGRYPAADSDGSFTGYWIGQPKFDAGAVLAWSRDAYRAIADFFGASDPPPFRVLMRGNAYPGGGGAALSSSFLVSYPDTLEDATELRETIAHETVHNWISSIGGPPGSSSWFSEGLTVHYTRWILLRSGLFTAGEFLDSVNGTARSYYTNAMRNLPNDAIAAAFWRDTRVRSLPYARGSLYFAAVDARIRTESGGARTLHDLVQAFFARRDAGETVTGDTWREIVVAELGAAGTAEFDAMLAGELVVPPDEAFGPCFRRETAMLRDFELGFDRATLVSEPRIVKGLIEGSAAASAGLRDGDEIVQPVALESAQADPEETITLKVRRDREEFALEYLPRGAPVEGFEWVRKEEMDASSCRY